MLLVSQKLVFIENEAVELCVTMWKHFTPTLATVWHKCFRSSRPEVLCKKVFLEIPQILQKNTCARVYFLLNKFIKKGTLAQVFS